MPSDELPPNLVRGYYIIIKEEVMKRKILALFLSCCCISILAGCQETPKEAIVKEKGADSIKEYESAGETDGAGETGSALREMVDAPEKYTNKASYEDGGLVIDTDAEVILPDVSSMNTYSVSAKEVNQDMIDTVTQAFFEGAKFYNGVSYDQLTKKECEEELMRLKKFKAEGNVDPFELGKDDFGELYYDIDGQIAWYEEEMQSAPEEKTKEEVKPSFGLEYGSDKTGEKEVDEDSFLGVAETEQGNYDYRISYGLKPDIIFKIEKRRDDGLPIQEFKDWVEGEYQLGREGTDVEYISEDQMKSFIKISREDAEKIAKEKVDKLGWDMEVYGSDYALYHHGEGGITESSILTGGYIFHFARVVDGAFITHTSEYGGGLEDMDSTLTPWSYERCDVTVTDEGIEKVELINPYDIGEIQTENVKLKDFDSIMKIYEQMMEVSNADITQFEANRTYHIKKIVLGYGRIYDPTTDSDTGLLVPVWDFFGGFDAERDGFSEKNNGEYSTQSFMTINAIDGTVIDRSLGY